MRDIARYLDVTNGFDPRDPTSLPRVEGWEAALGTRDLRGRRVVISPDLGRAVVDAEVVATVMGVAEALVEAAGLTRVDIPVKVPDLGLEWALAGLAEIRHDLGDAYPECADDLTPQIAFGLRMAEQMYDLKARVRIEGNPHRDERDDGGPLRPGRFHFHSDCRRCRLRQEGSVPDRVQRRRGRGRQQRRG